MNKGFKRIIVAIFLLVLFLPSYGQSINELRKEKEKTGQEIEYINNLLKETDQNTKTSISRMTMLEKKIRLQESLISNISNELSYLDSTIIRSSQNLDSLKADLTLIKNRYANMLRYARRNQDMNNQLLFLLSAEDFNQAYKRFTYLKQYADYRKTQVKEITDLQSKLANLVEELNNKKFDKTQLLSSKISLSDKYEKQKADQKEYYVLLQKKEKDLRKKLENQQKIAARLEQEIEKSIAEEARRIASKASAKSAAGLGVKASPERKILSDDFSKNKGKLPWPVSKGLVTDHFGEHPDPLLKHVTRRNSGIDITTLSGTKARAVFKGEVTKVLQNIGGNMAIIIRHGSYLTVYSNLASVSVQVGQMVDTKQEIGTIYTDKEDDNKTVLKFQLWYENNKQDPEKWINI
ncbi:MAG: peptidoglycan DD-metalloendopeptidase family protein [Prolixibacteraceae bacterium]|jgi:septal ring factor EnvC (AmiA/AmiB activator)|nr:peptidoglycan DD-metalloendopeptidase family protein [Prolixibacteraceae bacterium]